MLSFWGPIIVGSYGCVLLARYNFLDIELTDYDLRARGSILHDLYHGMESICIRIFKAIDEKENPVESKLDQSR